MQVCKLADIVDNLSDMARLNRERHGHALARATYYYDGLRQSNAPEMQGPLAIVAQAIADARRSAAM